MNYKSGKSTDFKPVLGSCSDTIGLHIFDGGRGGGVRITEIVNCEREKIISEYDKNCRENNKYKKALT